MGGHKNVASRRVTIMIQNDNLERLHEFQARRIKLQNKPFSFSKAINEILRKGFAK